MPLRVPVVLQLDVFPPSEAVTIVLTRSFSMFKDDLLRDFESSGMRTSALNKILNLLSATFSWAIISCYSEAAHCQV